MSSIRTSLAKYASGTIVSQVLVVAATPVITRMYSPAAFGSLALFTSLYGILIHFTTLKLELSILLPKERRTAMQSTVLALCVCMIFGLLLSAALLVWAQYNVLPWHYALLPCALSSGAIFSLAQLWCSREKDFLHIGLGTLLNAIINISFCVTAFLLMKFPEALVAGYTLGLFGSAIYLASIKHEVVRSVLSELPSLGFGRLRTLFVEGLSFPIHVLPSTLLTSLAYQIIPLLMVHFFSSSVVGLYSVANRLLYLPSVLVAGAFSDIFRSELMTRMHGGSDALRFFRRSLALLLLLTGPAYIVLWWLSPMLFRIFLGSNFAEAGVFARYLCAGVAANLVVTCFSYVFIAARATGVGLVLQVISTIATIAGFMVGALRHDILIALLFMSIFSAVTALPVLYIADRRLFSLCFASRGEAR